MLKRSLTLILVLFLASCGKNSPVIVGVDLPPDNNTPVGSNSNTGGSSSNPSTVANSTSSAPDTSSNGATPDVTPAPVVKVFDAPMVVVRGTIQQQQTAMNTPPGT